MISSIAFSFSSAAVNIVVILQSFSDTSIAPHFDNMQGATKTTLEEQK